MTKIGEFTLFDTTVTLYEDLSNHNIIGRSIYSLAIVGNGTYIKHLGDNKTSALQEFENQIRKLLEEN